MKRSHAVLWRLIHVLTVVSLVLSLFPASVGASARATLPAQASPATSTPAQTPALSQADAPAALSPAVDLKSLKTVGTTLDFLSNPQFVLPLN